MQCLLQPKTVTAAALSKLRILVLPEATARAHSTAAASPNGVPVLLARSAWQTACPSASLRPRCARGMRVARWWTAGGDSSRIASRTQPRPQRQRQLSPA